MALSLVATVGASTANSYVTAATADTYFEAHPEYETWDKLYTAQKERYLILATKIIDTERIDGDKYTITATSGVADQALRFPRSVDYDDGSKFIPKAVQDATCEQAVYMSKTGASSTRMDLQAQGVTSVTIGDVSETYGGNADTGTQLCRRARQLLIDAGLIKMGGTWA
jgi:hypothetical protein